MARDLGGRGESSDRKDDWQRIEWERADRHREQKAHDATHDPGLLFELQATRMPDVSHREHRKIPPEVAALFGRTPEQFEALKQAEQARKDARAERAREHWTNEYIPDENATERTDATRAEGKEMLPDDRGTLVAVEGRRVLEIPLTQTDNGPAQRFGGREALGIPAGSPVDTHIEAHAAAFMRARGTKYAELYVNREPCPGRSGCESLLPSMLAPRTALLVRTEDGLFTRTYVGQADTPQKET